MSHSTHYDYDLIVIGSGAGGGVVSHITASAGKKVAIVEQENLGGECPRYGCIPTKALLHSAEIYDAAKHGDKYGIHVAGISYNYSAVLKWKDSAVMRTGISEGDRAYVADGITVLKGHAHFLEPHVLAVGKKRYTAKKFVVATGTKNFIPPIKDIEKVGYITYREAISLKNPPKSLLIIGGGAIGCEFAQFFSIFGSKVHIAEMAPRLLAREDADIGGIVEALFTRDRGMRIHTNAKVTRVEKLGNKKVVHFEKGGHSYTLKVDEIMLSAGKIPNTDLGLENAGVKYTKHGITVSDTMQTSAKHIFAAGDVTGKFMFTHVASYQSRIAAHNILHRNKVYAKYHAIPRIVFLTPEVAAVGITEEQAIKQNLRYMVGATSISVLGRSNTSDAQDGYVKVIALKKSSIIVGASIISPHAGEMIHELALAVNHGLTVHHIESTVHAFPAWSEAVRIACAKIA